MGIARSIQSKSIVMHFFSMNLLVNAVQVSWYHLSPARTQVAAHGKNAEMIVDPAHQLPTQFQVTTARTMLKIKPAQQAYEIRMYQCATYLSRIS